MSDRPTFVESALVDPGKETSEDIVDWSRRAFWVIDGATGLTDEKFTDAPTDGRWFVESFSEYLSSRVDDLDRTLIDVLEECVEDVRNDFRSITDGREIPEEAKPSGALALVRLNDGEVESLTLGDCSIIHKWSDGEITTQFGEGPRELDEKVVEEMRPMLWDDEYSYRDAREAVNQQLVEHRRMKNEEGGYWTLGLSVDAVSKATVDRHPVQSLSQSYVFSDGFEPVVDTYDMFSDWESAINYLDENGIQRAFRLMRAIENSDSECAQYPRLKPQDDAALGILSY